MKSGKYRLQHDIMFNPSCDNSSDRLWCRHNAGGDTSNRYGGVGVAFHHDSVEAAEETYHNVHVKLGSKSLSEKIPDGQWVTLQFDAQLEMPAKKFTMDAAIAYDLKNFKNVGHWTYTSKASGVNDQLEELYAWIRMNGPAKDIPWRNGLYQKLA